MFIKDLQPRQTKVDIEGEVAEMSDAREFSKFGKAGRVATAFIKDATGRVKLSLWNEQTGQVKVGDTVKITNGYVNEFQGEMQLTTGKFGTLEVVGKTDPGIIDDEQEESEALTELNRPHDTDSETEGSKLMSDIGGKRPEKKRQEDTSIDVEEEDFS